MLTGLDSNEIAIMCVASLLCLIVMVISYFCLELREAWVRQRAGRFASNHSGLNQSDLNQSAARLRAGGFDSGLPRVSGFVSGQTTGPMPAIDNFPACASNCCSASIVPP